MPTARQLCSEAMESAGIFKPTQSIAAQDMSFALRTLNRTISAFQSEQLIPYGLSVVTSTITPAQSVYTIGPTGADIVTGSVPVRVVSCRYSNGTMWYAMRQVQYSDIKESDQLQNGTDTPNIWAYNRAMPYGQIALFAAPVENYGFEVTVETTLPEYDLDDEVTLPSGYYAFLVAELGARLGPSYGVDTSHLRAEADRTINAIKSTNAAPPTMVLDMPIGSYDIYSDTWTRGI